MSDTRGQARARAGARARQFERSPAELQALIAAERTGHPFLVWRDGERRQRILELGPDCWRVTIGRDPTADVSLAGDDEVSRAHALVERVAQGSSWSTTACRATARSSTRRASSAAGGWSTTTGSPGQQRHHLPRAGVEAGRLDRLQPGVVPVLPMSPMQRKILIALCRPVQLSDTATPATNRQIADEVHLTVDAVKAHLRLLFERYG